ncbi:MAG TPA: hypothetical protein VN281_14830, partial [Verrucomicrobiae bacterium]|nr:hypothetical protein [Verrucomicrobiae bacterium]
LSSHVGIIVDGKIGADSSAFTNEIAFWIASLDIGPALPESHPSGKLAVSLILCRRAPKSTNVLREAVPVTGLKFSIQNSRIRLGMLRGP